MAKIIKKINNNTEDVEIIYTDQKPIKNFTPEDGWLIVQAVDCLREDGSCLPGYRYFFPLYLSRATSSDGESYELISFWDEDNQREHYIEINSIADSAYRFINYKAHKALGEMHNEMAVPFFEYIKNVIFSDSPVKTNAAFINSKGNAEFINGAMQSKELVNFVNKIDEDEDQEDETRL